MPLPFERALAALMRLDVLDESSERDFRTTLGVYGVIAQTNIIDPRLPQSSQLYGALCVQTRGQCELLSQSLSGRTA